MAAPNDLTLAGCELAIGADLSADPSTWAWTDMADPAQLVDLAEGAKGRLFAEPISIRVGKTAEGSQVVPATATFDLDNSDGRLTPDSPASEWWPYIDLDLPCRLTVRAGPSFLQSTGTGTAATTPDDADYDITSDITIRCLIFYSGSPASFALLGPRKYDSASNQRSYMARISSFGLLGIQWSTDGTSAGLHVFEAPVALPHAGFMAVEVRIDVDNGAGGHTVSFAYAPGLDGLDTPDVDWISLGQKIGSGTTSIHSGSAPLTMQSTCIFPVLGTRLYAGLGSGGSLRSSIDVSGLAPGVSSFVAATGETWTVLGEVTDRWPRLQGSVQGIRVYNPNPGVSGTERVQLTVSGDLQRLEAGARPLKSALTRMISSPKNSGIVVAHWPGEDGSNATSLASSIPGVQPMRLKGSYQLASDSRVAGSAPLMVVPAGESCALSADIPHIPQVTGVTWEIVGFRRIDEATTASPGTTALAVDSNGRVARWSVHINDTDVTVVGTDDDGGGVVLSTTPSDPRMFNTTLIVVLRVADNGADVDWRVSLIPVPLGVVFGGALTGTFTGNTGIPLRYRTSPFGPPQGITYGHTIVTTGTNLAGGVSWLAPADRGFAGETPARRAIRLCTEEGEHLAIIGDPDADLTVKMGPQTMGTLVEQLRDCAKTGLDVLTDQFGLAYRVRASLYNQPARMVIDRANKLRNLADPFEGVKDQQRYRNIFTAARPDGSEYTATAPDFDPARSKIYDQREEVNVETDEQLRDQAWWRLWLASSKRMRYPSMSTRLSEATDLVTEWLTLWPGDHVRLDNPPPDMPPGSISVLAEGWTERILPAGWLATLVNAPEEPWEVAVRDDPQRGVRDTAGSVLENSFDAGTDTTMDVATTLGPLWATSLAAPLELWVDGVKVTATAIGAPSGSVQTFTVSTSVSVVKTIPAGRVVHLWRRPVRAL